MTLFPKVRAQAGFSLIELMVVISIIALISTIGMLSFRQANMSARDAKRKATLETVRQALVLRKTEGSAYPIQTGGSPLNYFGVIQQLVSDDYLNGNTDDLLQDPGAEGERFYTYESTNGTAFTMCADLEGGDPDENYCVYSP